MDEAGTRQNEFWRTANPLWGAAHRRCIYLDWHRWQVIGIMSSGEEFLVFPEDRFIEATTEGIVDLIRQVQFSNDVTELICKIIPLSEVRATMEQLPA